MNKTKTSPTKQEPAPVLPAKVENGTKLTASPKKTPEVSKKVEVADNQNETSSTKTSNPQMPVFISRVASIPAVNTAIDYAFGVYGKAKVGLALYSLLGQSINHSIGNRIRVLH